MTLAPAFIEQAAIELVDRRTTGRQGARLPESCRPANVEDAWQIQREVNRRLMQPVGAWKASLPSPGKLVAAPIYANTISRTAVCVAPVMSQVASAHTVSAEPEVAFVLAHDLPVRDQAYTDLEIDASIGSVHAALEICASRYTDHDRAGLSFPEMLADGLVNAGLWLGPALTETEPSTFDLSWQAGGVGEAGDAFATPAVHLKARHPNGHPRAPLYWLVNFLRERGIALKAGQAVITGSYAGLLALPVGQKLQFEYAGYARFEVTFA